MHSSRNRIVFDQIGVGGRYGWGEGFGFARRGVQWTLGSQAAPCFQFVLECEDSVGKFRRRGFGDGKRAILDRLEQLLRWVFTRRFGDGGAYVFEKIVAVAGGERTKSELAGVGDEEFAPWMLGPTF